MTHTIERAVEGRDRRAILTQSSDLVAERRRRLERRRAELPGLPPELRAGLEADLDDEERDIEETAVTLARIAARQQRAK